LSFEEVRDREGMLAETEGVRLVVTQKAGLVTIGISNARAAAASSGTPAQWRAQLARHAIFLAESGIEAPAGAQGPRRTVAGLAGDAVTSVELRYRQGPPDTVNEIDGGFLFLADVDREPYEVVARNAAGEELERAPVGPLPK
jgi:hypothetical protein